MKEIETSLLEYEKFSFFCEERRERRKNIIGSKKRKNSKILLFLLFFRSLEGAEDRNTYKWDTFTRTDIINFFSLKISLCFVR